MGTTAPKSPTSAEFNLQSAAQRAQFFEILRRQGIDPHTYYQEAEMSSPYVNTHRDITYVYEPISLHSHAFYEVICCCSSCGASYLVGPYRYNLQKGDIILIRPGVSHQPILPDPLTIPYERDVLWLSPAFLEFARTIQEVALVSYEKELPSYLIRTGGTPWAYLCDMIHRGVLEETQKQFAWQSAVLGNTLQVVAHLHRASLSQTVRELRAEEPDLLDNIVAYIDIHYPEKIVMGDLAKQFFISERTIGSLFRQRLGTTFYQFLTQRRLIAAKTLIREGLPLEAVAEKAGFSDYSSFFRAFKQEFGISPRNFKQSDR